MDNDLNPKSLGVSIYDYLKYCQENETYKKGAGVITDKQNLFYAQLYDDNLIHFEMLSLLEKVIHPNMADIKIGNGDFSNNIHFFSLGREEITLSLPDDGKFSINQYKFLDNMLNDVEKFNSEYPNNKVDIDIILLSDEVKFSPKDSLDEIRQKLKLLIGKNIVIDQEKILGDTLSKSDYESALLYNGSFEDCKSIENIINKIELIYQYYYNDEIYGNILKDKFPNYAQIYSLLPVYRECDNLEVNDISFKNVQSVLINALKSSISNYQSFSDIPYSFFENNVDVLKQESGDLNIFFKLISSINDLYMFLSIEENNEIDNCFKKSESIEGLNKRLLVFKYNSLKNEITSLENTISYSKDRLKQSNNSIDSVYDDKKELENLIRKLRVESSFISDDKDRSIVLERIDRLTKRLENIDGRYENNREMNVGEVNNNKDFWIETIRNSEIKKEKLQSDLNEIRGIFKLLKIEEDFFDIDSDFSYNDSSKESEKVSIVVH